LIAPAVRPSTIRLIRDVLPVAADSSRTDYARTAFNVIAQLDPEREPTHVRLALRSITTGVGKEAAVVEGVG